MRRSRRSEDRSGTVRDTVVPTVALTVCSSAPGDRGDFDYVAQLADFEDGVDGEDFSHPNVLPGLPYA